MSGRYYASAQSQPEWEPSAQPSALSPERPVRKNRSNRHDNTQRSQDSALSLARGASDASISSFQSQSREPLNAGLAHQSSFQLEGYPPIHPQLTRKSSRKQSGLPLGASGAGGSATVTNSIGPFRPASIDGRLASAAESFVAPGQHAQKAGTQPLPALRSTEFKPGQGEQGISNIAQWMAGSDDHRASNTGTSVAASSNYDAMSADSPLPPRDASNVHAPPAPASTSQPQHYHSLHHTVNPIHLDVRESDETGTSNGSEDQGPYANGFLTGPEPSSSPTPLSTRKGPHTTEELLAISKFLRGSKIPKDAIGDVLTDSCQDSQNLLDVFTGSLDFQGLEIDEALRKFFDHVWLQGESEKMQRVASVFATHYYNQNPSKFRDQRASETAALAIIMLNGNLHNPKVPRQDVMTLQDFFRQMRGLNGGQDFQPEFLEAIFTRVSMREMKLPRGPADNFLSQPMRPMKLKGFWKSDKPISRALAQSMSLRASGADPFSRALHPVRSGRPMYWGENTGPALTGDQAAVAEKPGNGARSPGDALRRNGPLCACCSIM